MSARTASLIRWLTRVALEAGVVAVGQAGDRSGLDQDRALTSLLTQVKQKAPDGRRVLVTYLWVVPATECPVLSFTPEEASVVRTMGERLMELFVEVGADTGVVVVDP